MNKVSAQVDLTNCDREPIHQLGAIQPIGFLIAVTTDWIVARVSANIADFLGTGPDAMIGRPLADFVEAGSIHAMRNRLAILRGPDSIERIFRCHMTANHDAFDIAIHMTGGQIVIEAEPSLDEQHGDPTGTVRSMVSRLDQAPDMTRFFNEGARQIRALTGFDRVMVYRFAPDGSGEVVAEAARSGIGSFLGLHYPPTDIPAQARELYRRNLLRVIADIGAVPVPIIPARDERGAPIDLSLSVLRSVSPIHIEYLKNMGVDASMSISILVEGKLWGLFACHHYSARCPSFERRSVCELFAQMFAMRLESRERKNTVDHERRARDVADQLLGAVASDETLLKDSEWLHDMLSNVIPCDGVGVWIDGNGSLAGATPELADFSRILRALAATGAGRVYGTDHIADIFPEADRFAGQAAGMLAIPISRTPRDYVVLFRSEIIRSVRWAGDPHKPVEYGPNGPRLTPRESFAEWKELVQNRSQPFSPAELRIAETLRATLIEVVLRMSSEASAERKRANERQELLIAELNHRVRNILALIRGLIRQSKPAPGTSIEDFVKLVDRRIHALARAHNQITQDHWGPAPLRGLIEAEVAAFLAGRADRVEMEGPAVLLNPQAYSTLALVIHELVTNSIKYGGLSDSGRAKIKWRRDAAGDLLIDWRELGGPPVQAPSRRGFGTTIIERSIPYDIGGDAEIHYRLNGVEASFRIPERHVSEALHQEAPRPTPDMKPDTKAETQAEGMLDGKAVLLVEDSLIIALDGEDLLKRLGARDVAVAATTAQAFEAIEDDRPDAALLDINLGDGTSYAIADRLAELGVPFLFATGYGEQAQIPEQHSDRIVIQKPYTAENIARGVADLLAG
ncbi:HWE histidine kinase domain-containing protein [Allosphingosinicella indica]|uniref:histidine kinase n=1 Tax=Allosphingosinicella indica TaxID=941907 RepID=A0A1X7GZ79_9SPHN|nr:HWE histidine kinase domain-containing protein [Allosphingosinicella indica]SMF77047.1 Bacteriophytochrome (light-regulated signal transduction histidine kinase) [Allosphingosinicella indica]